MKFHWAIFYVLGKFKMQITIVRFGKSKQIEYSSKQNLKSAIYALYPDLIDKPIELTVPFYKIF